MFIDGPELPLHLILRGQSRVGDEFSDVSFIYQVVKVSSEGSTVHCAVTSPFVEGTVVQRSRLFLVRWERSGQMLDQLLVLDSIEDVIDGYFEWDEVELRFISLARFGSAPGRLSDNGGLWLRFFLGGNCGFSFSTSGPCLRG